MTEHLDSELAVRRLVRRSVLCRPTAKAVRPKVADGSKMLVYVANFALCIISTLYNDVLKSFLVMSPPLVHATLCYELTGDLVTAPASTQVPYLNGPLN